MIVDPHSPIDLGIRSDGRAVSGEIGGCCHIRSEDTDGGELVNPRRVCNHPGYSGGEHEKHQVRNDKLAAPEQVEEAQADPTSMSSFLFICTLETRRMIATERSARKNGIIGTRIIVSIALNFADAVAAC